MKWVSVRGGWLYWTLAFWCHFLISDVEAGTLYWTNSSGGSYSNVLNWWPNSHPSAFDDVVFTNNSGYPLTIDSGETNSTALFHQGSVTQAILAGPWYLTNAYAIGETSGSTARVTAVSGPLVVTNESRTAVLSIGRSGTGELAIRGGSITADILLATNGTRSVLTFAHGELTTIAGATVSNASKVMLGSTPSNLFIWNALGGTSRIITDQFTYGGLTLGANSGNSRARLNLTGSNTFLLVPGLDTYGRNEIYITGGAKFRTDRVQLGLQSGVSNVVVISDAGSSWINEYLMYFGMHSGAQTMVISNGGLFKTGGTTWADQHFDSFTLPGSTIIVTGSNSWFYSDGKANFGQSWSSTFAPLNCLVVVTNGGKFWARQLSYGSTNIYFGLVSSPGNLIRVAEGSLWIGSLTFAVGTLRFEAGSGTVDELNMIGGTNAVLQTLGNFYVGHHGTPGPGDLRVGEAITTISLNGQLQLGGWQIGVLAGDSGDATVTGGRVFVTNSSQTASLVVGNGGTGALRIIGGLVHADTLQVGPNGLVLVSNLSTLRLGSCNGSVSSVLLDGATLEFTSGTPAIANNAILTSNAVISFRGATGAVLDFNNPSYLGRIQHFGRTALQMIQTTNSSSAVLHFRDSDPSTWARLIFNGGASQVSAGSILIETNSSLAATNTISTIDGAFTNRGQLILNNSTLRFTGPAVLSGNSSFQGSRGYLLFSGGLHLPATDIIVPPGIALQASTITSDGGKLIINGGGIIPNFDGTVPAGMIIFQDGWVTYLDAAAAPLTLPSGLPGAVGLELVRSTNASVSSHTFANNTGGYERLRLGAESLWRSDQLTIGQGGTMFIADPSSSVALTSRVFRVEQGGLFRDDTGGTNHVGFSAISSNANATVSGTGSTWFTTNVVSVGATGPQNQLRVESGGKLAANSVNVGGITGSSNVLTLVGAGSSCFATNGLMIVGSQSQFLIQTGAVFAGSQILASGPIAVVSLNGTGAVANCFTQIVLSGFESILQVFGGANLFVSNGILNATVECLSHISGEGSLWKLTGGLTIAPSVFTNRVLVSDKGTVSASSLFLGSSSFSHAALSVQDGQLYVTNPLGSANLVANGPFELNGGVLHADKVSATNSTISIVKLNAGKAKWGSCDFSTGVPLRVGNRTNLASLELLGGTNICRGGLEVTRYSTLSGSGVIVGTVTNRGEIRPSSITIQSNLVIDSTSKLALTIASVPGSPQNSSLIVAGNVSLAGQLEILVNPGTLLSNLQNFVLIQSASISSNFINVAFGQRVLTADRLASFRIDNSGTAIIATDFQSEDLDGDGIQDSWAMQYFGFSPLLPGIGMTDLYGDWDGDKLSNRNEFLLGTDPKDPSSGLLVQIERAGQGLINLHFRYLPDRSHYVRVSSDLLNWSETLIENFWFDPNGYAVWSDTISSEPERRFYRLLVE